jgi:hypothetical protein
MKNPNLPTLIERQLIALNLSAGEVVSFICNKFPDSFLVDVTINADGFEGVDILIDRIKNGCQIAVLLPAIKNSSQQFKYWLVKDVWYYNKLGQLVTND